MNQKLYNSFGYIISRKTLYMSILECLKKIYAWVTKKGTGVGGGGVGRIKM